MSKVDEIKSESMIQMKCLVRGWAYNNFTAYLLETNLTASKMAYLMGMNAQTCYHWIKMRELPGAVNFIFLTARKMRLMGKDLFSYL